MHVLHARFRPWTTAVALALALASAAQAQSLAPAPVSSSEEQRQKAKAQYEQGVVAYDAQRFQEAVEFFLAADRLVPSAALSFNVARAYEGLTDTARALRYYRDFLRRAPGASNANADAARERVAALEAILMARGQQQLSVFSEPSGAELVIDGRPVGTTPWSGELTPGTHRLALSRTGHAGATRVIELGPAHALDVSLALPALPASDSGAPSAAPPPQTPMPLAAASGESSWRAGFGPWPWVTLGAGGAALLAAGAFELSRRSAESDAEAPELPQIAFKERIDAMHARQTTARALVAVGSVLALAGGALIWLDPARTATPRTAAAVACDPHSCLGSFALRY